MKIDIYLFTQGNVFKTVLTLQNYTRKVAKNMEITDIRVRKVPSAGKMKAVVSVTFDNAFVVHDIKIIEGQEKLFIAMPSRKTPEGEFKDIAHPINMPMREQLETAIFEKYEKTLLEDDSQEDEQ